MPATVATIAAPPIIDVIFVRVFIGSPLLMGRGGPVVDGATVQGEVSASLSRL